MRELQINRVYRHFKGDYYLVIDVDPASSDAKALVKRLQGDITENYYPCTKEILNSLGEMYAAGGEFTENIDKAGGEGTAAFAQRAIAIYCR